jgi:hypothetical protein
MDMSSEMIINAKGILLGIFVSCMVVISFLLAGFIGSSLGWLDWSQLGPESGLFQKGVSSFAGFYGGYVATKINRKYFVPIGLLLGVINVGIGVLVLQFAHSENISPLLFAPVIITSMVGAYVGNASSV